jgi:hypothetical protein
MLDNATVEFFLPTECEPNSPLGLCVWDEHKWLVYKSQREPFWFLELLQQRIENVWPFVSQDNVLSAIS